MSHFSNDYMIDNIISDVADMDKVKVMSNLNADNLKKVAGFTGDKDHGANIVDYARDVLIDQMYGDWLDMPGPHG
tara:strand:+ start:677 stop:901 length:225 start_codon:yes stop_codon:yes gene_type:complete